MGWFDDNHPQGEAHRPGGYMDRFSPPDYPRAGGKAQRRLEQRVNAALERAGSQKCGHTRGATLSQCHRCQAAMREAVEDEEPSYCGRFAYGFDSAGRADYEFDGKDDKAAQASEPKDYNKPVPEHWCSKCENEKPLAAFSAFQLERAGIPSDPGEFFEQQRESRAERKAERRQEQKNSEEYQEELAEWREEQQADRQCKRRQARQDARDNEAPGRREKKQRVEETDKPELSDSESDEADASDEDSAFDEIYFSQYEDDKDNEGDEDDEDDREPTVCIDCFWDFFADAYRCDDDSFWAQPMISESEWAAASKKGVSHYCGGESARNLRNATEEDALERIETRLEGSSEWTLP
jgi:hypothetical protein